MYPGTSPASIPFWWRALFPLLLASLFASMHLDALAFNRDEPDALFPAGIYASSPGTPGEAWRYMEENHASQARGWTLLLFTWGDLVGWSEPAIRSLSFLAGLLTIAWLYRAGHDLFAPRAGLFASILASASLFFLSYMLIARAFTLVALLTTLVLWSYWRLVIARRQSGPATLGFFLAGCVGLLYSHFFTALILPPLVLFHLLLAPRGKRWWQVIAALTAAAVLALAQVRGFLNGPSLFTSNQATGKAALDAAEIPHHFLYYMSNLTLRLPDPAGAVLLLLLIPALPGTAWRRHRAGRRVDAAWLLTFLAGSTFLLMVAANEVVDVITGGRIRYMLSLFPLLALLTGEALRSIRVESRLAVGGFLAFWLVLGPTLLNSGPSLYVDRYHSTFHLVQRWLQERAVAGDLVVLDSSLMKRGGVLYLHPQYIPLSDQPWETVFPDRDDPLEWTAPGDSTFSNLWVVHQKDDPDVVSAPFMAPDYMLCQRVYDLAGFTLYRFTKTAAVCSDA
ncbi:MAG: glycosyltransferase family 39 protein [Anaerolineaceae bacterium]|nr:glycosyltransferase family 39 protein [Anaerolineaceae bacterium]MCY4022096.1 glycosyltransferase family 39 protein [Anaerolineaceae bacterium]